MSLIIIIIIIIGHFGDESFPSLTGTGTDNRNRTNKRQTKKNNKSTQKAQTFAKAAVTLN